MHRFGHSPYGGNTHERYRNASRGKENLGFIPWFPLARGGLAKPGSALDSVAKKHNATPAQIALAWLLARSPVMLPIPGTSSVKHLEENLAGAEVKLSKEELAAVDAQASGR